VILGKNVVKVVERNDSCEPSELQEYITITVKFVNGDKINYVYDYQEMYPVVTTEKWSGILSMTIKKCIRLSLQKNGVVFCL
jgi:hypothetical protein